MYYINTLYTEQVMSRKKEKKVFESSVEFNITGTFIDSVDLLC